MGLTRRHVMSTSLVGAGAVALAACGGQAAPSTGATTKLAGTLEFWHWGITYNDGYETLLKEFQEKNPGVTINRKQTDQDQVQIPVTVAAGSGGPDVYMMRGPNFRSWANTGIAADITSYLSKDKTASADYKTALKAVQDFYVLNGKTYGLPWDLSTISIAFNLEQLDRLGLKSPADLGTGWDWNQFMEYSKRLNPGDGSKYAADIGEGAAERGWFNWTTANGGKLWSDDYKTITINTAENIEAIDAFMGISSRLKAAAPRDWLAQQTQGLPHAAYRLVNGLVFLQEVGDWFFPWYMKESALKWDIAPVPFSPKTKKTGSAANLRGSTLSPTAQNKDLAWAWMTYLMKREVQDRIPQMMGEVPARQDSIDAVYLNTTKLPQPKSRKLLKASLDSTAPLPSHPLIAPADLTASLNLMNDIYDGKRQTRDVVTEIQDKLTAFMKAK
jgi:multiple sugar transport system substrate-binding protein